MTAGSYPKVCEQCGVAFDSAAKNTRFCPGCADARAHAARLLYQKRTRSSPFLVPCSCGLRKINTHSGHSLCSVCRKEKEAALRRRVFAIPRAIGETMRLPDAPKHPGPKYR